MQRSPTLAAVNCENIHAVGGVTLGVRHTVYHIEWESANTYPVTLVKYARKAAPDRITGS